MTPNDIHASQTVSFTRIEQNMQAVSRIVFAFLATAVYYSVTLFHPYFCITYQNPWVFCPEPDFKLMQQNF